MFQFIIAGGVVAVVAAGTAVYKYFNSDSDSTQSKEEPPVSVGRFAIWGRPNVGKTTFINRLLGGVCNPNQKHATTSKITYKDIPVVEVGNRKFRIEEISDLPGTKDRLNNWIELVKTHDHVFYLIDISRVDSEYMAAVRADLKATVESLKESIRRHKRINIIATHIDKSKFKDEDPANVNNVVQREADFCKIYESIEGVAGYVYSVNLINTESYKRLLESIIRDSHA